GGLAPAVAPGASSGGAGITGGAVYGESPFGGLVDGVGTEHAAAVLIDEWGGPMYSGYIGQISPAEGLVPMPEAESESSRNLNWQNIGYTAQRMLFGGFFLYLWWRSVRTPHLDEQTAQREALDPQLQLARASHAE